MPSDRRVHFLLKLTSYFDFEVGTRPYHFTALAADPYPYSTHVQTRGSRAGSTAAACARGVSLADDANASAQRTRPCTQQRLEHAPAGVELRFCHPRLH
jgi:hypothetical protein